ncbi:four helix bundle protein [Bacteroidales bacterium OttesenSCG-928-K03]|nr:four helix bundle protein [Bacteroidales bacterium OttesenSCG-928-L14]MDL2243035.1 four helix bundle protein [Bacteroidales bacterium OttesenSCG-928-K03]
MINRFEDLEVWKLARVFVVDIYEITNKNGFANDFRFRDQIRASAASIMDNIAEGFERDGNKEFIQFLYIAKGSSGETRSQLYRALDLKYIDEEQHKKYLDKVTVISKQLSGFINYIKSSENKGKKYK